MSNMNSESKTDVEPDVKMVGKLLKAYGFKRVTIMRADGTVEEIE